MHFVTQPIPGDVTSGLPAGYCIACHRSDPDAGDYLELGVSKLAEPLYLCAVHFVELVRSAGEMVPLAELEEANRRLHDASQRADQLDHDLKHAGDRERDLTLQLERTQATVASQRTNLEILEQRLAETQRAPGAIAREQLLEQVKATA